MLITKNNKDNFFNLLSLSVIQASNTGFLLLSLTYVLATCGVEAFSKVVLTESVTLFVLSFILYGLDVISSERSAILLKSKKEGQLSKVFYSSIHTRVFLLLSVLPILLPLALWYDSDIKLVYVSWVLFLLGHILHSSWFFQIKNMNHYPALATFIARIFFLGLIYLFVKNSSDFPLAVLFIGLSYFLSGLFCLIYGIAILKEKYSNIDSQYCIGLLRAGKIVTFGNISVVLFRGSNVLLLGFFSNELAVSIYALSEKVIKGIQAIVRPVNQLMYPIFLKNTTLHDSNNDYLKKITKYTLPQIFFSMVIILLLYVIVIFDEELVIKYMMVEISNVVPIMIPAIFLGIGNYMLGTAGLNYIGRKNEYAKAIVLTGIISFILSAILIFRFNYYGAALGYILGELILLLQIIRIYQNNIKT